MTIRPQPRSLSVGPVLEQNISDATELNSDLKERRVFWEWDFAQSDIASPSRHKARVVKSNVSQVGKSRVLRSNVRYQKSLSPVHAGPRGGDYPRWFHFNLPG
jgi:hypothetical protein